MPTNDDLINPNALVNVIRANKGKRVNAKTLIEKAPVNTPVYSKLVADNGPPPNDDENNLRINRSALESIHKELSASKQNNEYITKLFPEVELAIQILVSAILSPKKMTDITITYKLKKNVPFNTVSTGGLLDVVREYVEEEYGFEEKLPDIVREALFETGAYVQAVIPEASLDGIINTDILARSNLTEFQQGVDVALESISSPISLKTVPPVASKNPTDAEKFVHSLITPSVINITDNSRVFGFEKIKEGIRTKLIKRSIRDQSLAMESHDRVEYLDLFRERSTSGDKQIQMVKPKSEAARRSLGKPLMMKLPTESVVPVFIPGNESEHIGYFVLLDEAGKPISSDTVTDNVSKINSHVNISSGGQQQALSATQKAYNNLIGQNKDKATSKDLFELYKDILERQIFDSVRKSIYNPGTEIKTRNDVYFLMFTRAMTGQKTSLVFLPKELVTYYAFKHGETGVGVTLFENMQILASMRAILLMSRVMAQAKQAIDVTKVNISLDPNDTDPEKTISMVQDSVLKLRQNFLPLGLNNPLDLVSWIQRAGLQFSYENNPLIPNVKIDFENANIQHTIPDSGLEDDLRKQFIIAMSLPPETVDNGFSPEFATTVVNDNILLAKRVSVYQAKLSAKMSEFIGMLISSDETLRSKMLEKLQETGSINEETLTEEEKAFKARAPEEFLEYYIDQIGENILLELPKPENTNLVNLSAEFELYSSNLTTVIDTFIGEEALAVLTEDTGLSLDQIKGVYKHHLLRKWCAENNYYPEVLDLIGGEEDTTVDVIKTLTNYLNKAGQASAKLLSLIKKSKDALTTDISNITGGEGMGDTNYGTGGSSGGDGGGDGDGDGSEGGNKDDMNDLSLDLF